MIDNIYSPYKTDSDIHSIVRRRVDDAGGVRKLARYIGCHPGDITHFLKGTRGPSPALLEGLELEKVVYYVHKPHTPDWVKEKTNA